MKCWWEEEAKECEYVVISKGKTEMSDVQPAESQKGVESDFAKSKAEGLVVAYCGRHQAGYLPTAQEAACPARHYNSGDALPFLSVELAPPCGQFAAAVTSYAMSCF